MDYFAFAVRTAREVFSPSTTENQEAETPIERCYYCHRPIVDRRDHYPYYYGGFCKAEENAR